MKQSFSLKFYLHPDRTRGYENQIFARIIVNRQKVELATDLYTEPRFWDPEKERTKRPSDINDSLALLYSSLYNIKKRIEDEKKLLTAKLIKRYYKGDPQIDPTILAYYQNHLDEMGLFVKAGKIAPASLTAYKTTYKAVSRFLADHKQLEDLNVSQIDFTFVREFDVFLKTGYKDKFQNPISNNYANKQHSRFRTVLIKAVKEGLLPRNPYERLRLKDDPTRRDRLTEDEVMMLSHHELAGNESLIRVRDFFLFSCYTGLRFSDAYHLKMNNIVKDKDGNPAIDIRMGKTKQQVYIPLLDPAFDIIERYKEDPARKIFNYVLPRYSNQKVNAFLKTIAELVNMDKKLTHHVARHTCATLLLNAGFPLEVVQEILGHTSTKHTKIYAKMDKGTITAYMKNYNKKFQAA